LQEQDRVRDEGLGTSSRVSTGIEGLDSQIQGGLPAGSITVLAGRPGTGKTLFAASFLYQGASNGESCVYLSFAESRAQFISNMNKFGLDFQQLIDKKVFEFIDLTTVSTEAVSDALNIVLNRVVETGAKRLVVDSFSAIAQAFDKMIDARMALHVIFGKLVRGEQCTILLLVEMPYGTEKIGLGIEEFVADGIIILDCVPRTIGYLRTISVMKMRGTQISLDRSTYEISSENGLEVFPSLKLGIEAGIGSDRTSTRIPGLDAMIQGGLPERSVTALVGAAGTGKTTFALQFIYSAASEAREKGLIVSFGESRDQLEVVGKGLGMDRLRQLILDGLVTIAGVLPEGSSIEAHAANIERLLSRTSARRVVFDDVTALQPICTDDEYYLFLKKITQIAKSHNVTTVLTLTTNELAGSSITGAGLSTVMDSIILMRYVELAGKMDRSMTLLKMRGTKHDNSIKKFRIGRGGITMTGSFAGYSGVLTGTARRTIAEFEAAEKKIARHKRANRTERRRLDKIKENHSR
jgi:circadian clock protein KaiC